MRLSPLSSAVLSGVAVGSFLLMSPAVSSTPIAATTASSTTTTDDCPVREYAMGIRYQQSAHAAAAQLQSWSLAESRLRDALRNRRSGEKLAVVSDLDETVLDNSPLLARDLQACHTYTTWDTWSDWEVNGHPTLTPGAAGFFRYADAHHVAIYYISDRFQENKASTLATLRDLGLPQVNDDQVLLYGPTKEQRRQVAEADHDVVLLLGDSLPDFSAVFDGKTPDQQATLVAQNAAHFGRDWIMFPNATYGSWKKSPLKAWDEPLTLP
ncbi:5'-nucleotidase, lipoprotein e(P4) family [Nocardioides phosphati]|uniref:5'-nucleotidase, lipoprotein e(P4) family n=1 Tax=Nocardioides phosphati TaxID=1867775 RepID=A0ABQ2NAF5_9ACTN|nr:HAD family acid phosphatase [Nocardioides phosphati]GGO88625.1 5'-nucleotidase, lipoprotein e(P4) family [Nocardioides phosphati]